MTAPARTPNDATTTRPEQSSRRTARKSPLGWLPWLLLGLLALLLAAVLLVINAVDDDGPDGPAGDTLGQVGSNGSGIDGEDGDGQIAGTEEDSDASTDASIDASTDGSTQGSTQGSTDSGTTGTGSTGSGATGTGSGATQGAALTADGQDLLAASGGSLAARAGQAVTGTAKVESVVSDEGFWVGNSAQERVFVFLTPEARKSQGESGFTVTAGQTVQLQGSMTGLAQAPQAGEGVTADEGRAQLEQQGAYVRADAVSLA